MSVVCNIVSASGSWLACDGRASRDGNVVSEHTQKFRPINNNVLVGFTGALETAEQVLDHISDRCGGAVLGNVCSDDFAEILSLTLKKSNIELVEQTTFLVTGKMRSGEIASFVIKQSGEVTPHKPSSENQVITTSIGDLREGINLNDCLRRAIKGGILTQEAIFLSMKDYISLLASACDSVNENVIIAELLR